jgi:sec-independent protein translocase protein TatA
MGGMSLFHWLLVGAVVLVLFGGKGKISDIMGDVAKGVKAFKKGLADDETAAKPAETPRTIEHQATTQVDASRDVNKAG